MKLFDRLFGKKKHKWRYVENLHYLDSTCVVNKSYYECVYCGKRKK
jgi:hypothetical protein